QAPQPQPMYYPPEAYFQAQMPIRNDDSHLTLYALIVVILFGAGYALLPYRDSTKPVAVKKTEPPPQPVVAAVTPAVRPAPPAPPPAPVEHQLTSQEVTKLDEKQELEVYLKEGREFLRKGDFQSAANAFQIAIVID